MRTTTRNTVKVIRAIVFVEVLKHLEILTTYMLSFDVMQVRMAAKEVIPNTN